MPGSPSAWYTTRRGRIRVEAAVAAAGLFLMVGPVTVAFSLEAPEVVLAISTSVALLTLGLGMLALYVEVMTPIYGGRPDRSGEFGAAAFEEDESERAVARLVSGNGPPPLHPLLVDVGAAQAPPDVDPWVSTPPRAGGIAERWFWLAYEIEENRRLPLSRDLDGSALGFDGMLTGERDLVEGPPNGPMSPPPRPASAGPASHARGVREVRRILRGGNPRNVNEALLVWLVKGADSESVRLLAILFPTSRDRLRARRRLRAMFPGISAEESYAQAAALIGLHHASFGG